MQQQQLVENRFQCIIRGTFNFIKVKTISARAPSINIESLLFLVANNAVHYQHHFPETFKCTLLMNKKNWVIQKLRTFLFSNFFNNRARLSWVIQAEDKRAQVAQNESRICKFLFFSSMCATCRLPTIMHVKIYRLCLSFVVLMQSFLSSRFACLYNLPKVSTLDGFYVGTRISVSMCLTQKHSLVLTLLHPWHR